METKKGIPLNSEEIKLINALRRLEKQWSKHGKDLWLYSASSTLNVMMRGSTSRNPHPEELRSGSANQDNKITTIDIPNDGGDW